MVDTAVHEAPSLHFFVCTDVNTYGASWVFSCIVPPLYVTLNPLSTTFLSTRASDPAGTGEKFFSARYGSPSPPVVKALPAQMRLIRCALNMVRNLLRHVDHLSDSLVAVLRRASTDFLSNCAAARI